MPYECQTSICSGFQSVTEPVSRTLNIPVGGVLILLGVLLFIGLAAWIVKQLNVQDRPTLGILALVVVVITGALIASLLRLIGTLIRSPITWIAVVALAMGFAYFQSKGKISRRIEPKRGMVEQVASARTASRPSPEKNTSRPSSPAETLCPKCSARNRAFDNYCEECGASLKEV